VVTFRTRSLYSLHNTADIYATIKNKLEYLWNKSLPQRDTQMQMVEHTARHKVQLNQRGACYKHLGFLQEEGRKPSQLEQAPRAS